MRLPDDKSKFTSRWKYTEVARWVEFIDKDGKEVKQLARLMTRAKNPKDRKPIVLEWDQVEEYRKENNNFGLYTSVWNYDRTDIDRATRLGPLYFDFDSDDVARAQAEAIRLVDYLSEFVPESGIRTYYTGKKGFHIECEPIPLGISPSNELPGLFRYIANQLRDMLTLDTLDFAVYDTRRMWRLPNSQHQSTGLYKVDLGRRLLGSPLIDIERYAKEPHWDEVPEQVFDPKANEWYREWSYKELEAKSFTIEDRIARFNKRGSGGKKIKEGEISFDAKALLENCHAINDLWSEAERTHDLSHEARLFLCSILTYTEESEQYLHAILSQCDDYNEHKSQSHIDDWKRRREMGIGGRPYSCQRANSAGVGCGDCHLEARPKVEKVGDKWVETGEEALPSPIRFAYPRLGKGHKKEYDSITIREDDIII